MMACLRVLLLALLSSVSLSAWDAHDALAKHRAHKHQVRRHERSAQGQLLRGSRRGTGATSTWAPAAMLRRKAHAFYSLAHGYREGITTRCNYVGGSCDCIEKEWNVSSRKCERGRSGRQQPIVLSGLYGSVQIKTLTGYKLKN